jgi:hypothetical protein
MYVQGEEKNMLIGGDDSFNTAKMSSDIKDSGATSREVAQGVWGASVSPQATRF